MLVIIFTMELEFAFDRAVRGSLLKDG